MVSEPFPKYVTCQPHLRKQITKTNDHHKESMIQINRGQKKPTSIFERKTQKDPRNLHISRNGAEGQYLLILQKK